MTTPPVPAAERGRPSSMHETRKDTRWTLSTEARPLEFGTWVWPLAALCALAPAIVGHEHGGRHGVDVGFVRELACPRIAVHAAQGATITYAQRTRSGFAISIEH